MRYFTDSEYERLMMQKPKQCSPPIPKDKQGKREPKIRKLIVVHQKNKPKNGGA